MKLRVNGEDKELADGLTVASLLETLDVKPDMVAVEVNLDIIPKDKRGDVTLVEGDEVEIVKFVGGGSGGKWVRKLTIHEPTRPPTHSKETHENN